MSQVIYGEGGRELGSLDFPSCLRTLETDLDFFPSATAVCPDGQVYLIDDDSIYTFSPATHEIRGEYGLGFAHNDPYVPSGAACDHDGNIIFGGSNGVSRYNIYNKQYEQLGLLPNGFLFGDMIFYQGKAYALDNSADIIELDLENLANTTTVQTLPFTDYFGTIAATALNMDCDSTVIILLPLTSSPNGELYTYDFETNTAQFLCDQTFFGDFGSDLEFIQSNCILTVDLDLDNSSGYIVGDFGDTTDCGPVEMALSDVDVDVYSQHGPIDSITVSLIDTRDGVDEYLQVIGATPDVGVRFDSPQQLTLINMGGAARFVDFEAAIKTIRYHHDLQVYSEGVRYVEFRPYSLDQIGDSTVMHLHLLPPSRPDAGADTTIRICADQIMIDLDTVVSRGSGRWLDGQSVLDLSQPREDTLGLIATDMTTCIPEDTSNVFVIIIPYPEVDLGNDTTLCDIDNFPLAATGTYDIRRWFDGRGDSIITVDDFGSFRIAVQNGGVCTSADTITITQNDGEVVIDMDTSVCVGNTIFIDTAFYGVGDTAFMLRNTQSGCDTLIRYIVGELPIPDIVSVDTAVCAGSTIFIDTAFYGVGDTAFSVRIAPSGCDTLIQYIVGELPMPDTVRLDTSVCPGEPLIVNGVPYEVGDTIFSSLLAPEPLCDTPLIYTISTVSSPFSILLETVPQEIFSGDTITHRLTGAQDSVASGQWVYNGSLVDSSLFQLSEQVSSSGQVTWMYTDIHGCTGELTNTYVVQTPQFTFYIPNAFSPNDDGINDVFAPLGPDLGRLRYTMSIYDRWGSQVFSSSSATGPSAWDGTVRGKALSSDVFVYVIQFYEEDELIESRQGEVMLVR